MLPTPPTAAPPSFYDNLPAGGDAAAGATGTPGAKKPGEADADEELMKGLTGVFRVLGKMAKLKKDDPTWKAGIDELKKGVKNLVVQGLKKDPSMLESGEEKPAASAPPEAAAAPAGAGGAPPSQTDESHAA